MVPINLDPGYAALVGPGALPPGLKEATKKVGRVFIVVDEGVPETLVDEALATVTSTMTVERIDPSEKVKTLDTVVRLLESMTRARLERQDLVIAIGGGIVGDIAGFCAASYRRGVDIIQCPTTLLAMVDASVGGKTGVNLEVDGVVRKNFVGAFHQPRAVFADVRTLESLDPRVYRSGLAECVKHALLSGIYGDAGLFQWLTDNADALRDRDLDLLEQLVERNMLVKAAVVETDEFEQYGTRALLNLGHTFAHAIEPLAGVHPEGEEPPLHHGEAVAIGLMGACSLGGPAFDLSTVESLLTRFGLPTKAKGLPSSEVILEAMRDDKKVQDEQLHLVVPEAPGLVRIRSDIEDELVLEAIDRLRA